MNPEENERQRDLIEKDRMNEYYEMVKKASNTSEELANGFIRHLFEMGIRIKQ